MLQFIYPLKPPSRTRDRSKPMQVLALGLPRSGTDALRTALLILGYTGVWHGIEMASKRTEESAAWEPLLRAKANGNDKPARTYNYDLVLGDCEVLMDMPPAMFAEELLDFYPDAKVVLNRRKDMDAWHRSMVRGEQVIFGSWIFWAASWFDTELFWWYKQTRTWFVMMCEGRTMEENGKKWAEGHYAQLEAKLKAEGIEYLDWEVQEGWEPLCKFLGKDIPQEEFPWTNRTGADFQKNAEMALGKMVQRGLLRLGAVVSIAVALTNIKLWRTQVS